MNPKAQPSLETSERGDISSVKELDSQFEAIVEDEILT
jgi:hypothetical protein